MKIIGAGFGRTGTMSLCAALVELGFDPCYHMLEVFKHPSHIQFWTNAAEGQPVDWRAALGMYESGLDYPLAGFYQELLAVFPDAKVILTVRDPSRWYESTLQTIYRGTAIPGWLLAFLPLYRGMQRMVQRAIWDRLFDGRFDEREHAIRVFEDHIKEVMETVPAEKLLVYDVKHGWEPLCRFLDVPVPDKPFPHINDRSTTQRMYLVARVLGATLAVSLLALLTWIIGTVFL
jgi:hypothetical protein